MSEYDYFFAQFVDIHGRPKAKLVPATHQDNIFKNGVGFAGFGISGMGLEPYQQEYMAIGDPLTLRPIPWLPKTALVTCDGYVDKKPYPLDSRIIAQKAINEFKNITGLNVYTGLEPEFFLLKKNQGGDYISATESDFLDKPSYDFLNLNVVSKYLIDLKKTLELADIDVYQMDHEDANGQFEVNFTFKNALKTADNFIYFKMAAHAIAKEHNLICSFMPKPFSQCSGSGLHMHISIGLTEKENLFEDLNDSKGLGLSQLAYYFLGGLLAHAPGLTAIAAPSFNSYKRLCSHGSRSGTTWAPINISYGYNNRTACVRVTDGRLELRIPDSSANPYLLTASVIYAGLDGIKQHLEPGEPSNNNLHKDLNHSIKKLPATLADALDALEKDSVLCLNLGTDFIKTYLKIKREEIDDLVNCISAKEFNKYIEFY